MSLNSSVFVQWELLGLLAAEVGLVVLVIGLLLKGRWPVAWKRVLCQIGLLTVLLVAGCEISGYSSDLVRRIRALGTTKHGEVASRSQTQPSTEADAAEAIPKTPPD